MSASTIIVDSGPVTRITLNRPERHNAINTAMGDELVGALTTAGRSPDVKVIVLKGAGRSFCSGDDRTEGAGGRIPDFPWQNPYHSEHVEAFGVMRHGYFQLMGLIRRIPQLVIAQVHGYCMGSGVDLLLASDFAVADPDAQIQLVFGSRAIGPAGTTFLPRYVGLKRTMKLLFAEEFLSGTDAEELGLITKVAAPGALEQEVDTLAARLLNIGRQAYGYFGVLKETINRALYPTLDDDIRMQILATRLSDFFRMSHPNAQTDLPQS